MTKFKITVLNKKGKEVFSKEIKWKEWLVFSKERAVIFKHENGNVAHFFSGETIIFEEI